jgi:hypothetical protein
MAACRVQWLGGPQWLCFVLVSKAADVAARDIARHAAVLNAPYFESSKFSEVAWRMEQGHGVVVFKDPRDFRIRMHDYQALARTVRTTFAPYHPWVLDCQWTDQRLRPPPHVNEVYAALLSEADRLERLKRFF